MNKCKTQKKKKKKKRLPKHVPTAKVHLLKNTIEIDIGYIKNIHQGDVVTYVESVTETMEITHESEDNNNEEIINASFVSENCEAINLNIFVIDKDTPIYQLSQNDDSFKRRKSCTVSTAINLDIN